MPGGAFPDAVEVLHGAGIPRFAARLLARELQGPVTDSLCHLLPDVTSTSASAVMAGVSVLVTESAPGLLARIDPDLSAEHLSSALVPALWLAPIGMELGARRPGTPRSQVSSPAPELRALRGDADEMVSGVLGMYLTGDRRAQVDAELATIVQSAIGLLEPGQDGVAWGGWAILAATALTARSSVLPRPGRSRPRSPRNRDRGRAAGAAYAIGTVFVQSAALALIDEQILS